jgi:uncharacterized protein YjeT (DUF2065 family)
MAYDPKFAEQRAYERNLTEDSTLRRRAAGLIVVGTGCLLAWMASGDVFTLTVGLIALGAGIIWRWRLA